MEIVAGRYGLSSKDTTPAQLVSVFENLKEEHPKDNFTIGIVDDVTYTSLPVSEEINTTPEGVTNAEFWGLGSDGRPSEPIRTPSRSLVMPRTCTARHTLYMTPRNQGTDTVSSEIRQRSHPGSLPDPGGGFWYSAPIHPM